MSNSEDTNTMAKFIINNVAPYLKKNNLKIHEFKVSPVRLVELMRMIKGKQDE
jgi:Asp-tRNA(Asn)/Glu-tRNA(Gln) amidotransferase B subunit